jgi:6-phosphogluconolactonase (cycloisomerase 2 family)
MYSANYNANSVSVLSRNTATGKLTAVEHIASTSYLNYVYHVECNENYLYACARYNKNIAVFERNSTAGTLTYLKSIAYPDASGTSTGTRCVALSPNGRFLEGCDISGAETFSFRLQTE